MKTLDILISYIKLIVITAIIVISFLVSDEIYCIYLKVHKLVLYKKYILSIFDSIFYNIEKYKKNVLILFTFSSFY